MERRPSIKVSTRNSETAREIYQVLSQAHYVVQITDSSSVLLSGILNEPPEIVLLDLDPPDSSSPDLPAQIKQISPATRIIIISSQESLEASFDFIQQYAFAYVTKPVDLIQLAMLVDRASECSNATPPAFSDLENRYRQLFNSAGDGVFLAEISDDGRPFRFIDVSDTACRMLGYTREELLSTRPEEVVLPECLPRSLERAHWMVGTNRGSFETTLVRKDGKPIRVESHHEVFERDGSRIRLTIVHDITDRKPAGGAVREGESRYHELAETLPIMLFETDGAGRVDFMNRTGLAAFGYTQDDISQGLYALDHIAPEDKERAVADIARLMNGEIFGGTEYTALRADGSRFPVIVHAYPVVQAGKGMGMRGTIVDLSGIKDTERALRESSQFNQEIISSVEEGIIVYDRSFRYTVWNSFMERLTGMSSEEVMGKFFMDVFPELALHGIPEFLRRALNGETVIGPDMPLTMPGTRKIVWLSRTYGPHRSPAGDIVGVIATVRNVTDRKLDEEKYRSLFDTMAQGVVCQDTEGMILSANPAAEEMLGMTVEQMADSSIMDPAWHVICEDGSDLPVDKHPSMVAGRTGCEIHNVVMGILNPKGNGYQWFSVNAIPQFRPGEGEPYQVYTTFQDITERICYEARLSRLNETLSGLVDASPLAIIAIDTEQTVQAWNPAAERIFGWSKEEILSHPLPIVQEYARAEFEANYESVLHGSPVTGLELRRQRKDGTLVDVRVSVTVLRLCGTVNGIMAVIEDITERKQLEEQLRQSQRMEALGRVAAGVAHDFKNLLMGISGYAELLQMKLDQNHPDFATVNDLLMCVDKATKLANQLQAFGKHQPIDPRPIDINRLIEAARHLIERIMREDVALELDLSAEPSIADIDPGQIEQVLINLIVNASDAMPDGGTLTIRTTNRCVDERKLGEYAALKPGDYVEIAIADTGVGMDRATQERIFEPFFTTKRADNRSGLGLAVSYGIIRQHKGHISVSSSVGNGTTCRVYLPISTATEGSPSVSTLVQVKGGAETILIAEDEHLVRTPLKVALEVYGYKVLAASDGEEALDLFAKNREDVDLLILDSIMPKAGGEIVWQNVQKVRPDVKAIFISGHAGMDDRKNRAKHRNVAFMIKPFSIQHLAGKIRELLDWDTVDPG